MSDEYEMRNLMANPSFEEGGEEPLNWQWEVISRRPMWAFDDEVKYSGMRCVRILQDVGRQHGEFRQVVKCKGGVRYRLRARVKVAVEGTGEDSGANLCLVALENGAEAGRLEYRPFFVGREDWRLWEADYVTPPEADALRVSFDMRRSSGVAWFDEVELFEVPAPLAESVAPPESPIRKSVGAMRARSVRVLADEPPRFLIDEVLRPLVGGDAVSVARPGEVPSPGDADAVVVYSARHAPRVDFDRLRQWAEDTIVILTPDALVGAVGDEAVSADNVGSLLVAPCAQIETANFLTRGMRKGDVVPWWSDGDESGLYRQRQVRADAATLAKLGFETIATSVCAERADCGRPVILWRPGRGGGILVMDLEPLNFRPRYTADSNLACLVLSNALGRPQTSLGTYIVPHFDYDRFAANLHSLAERHSGLELCEEGRSSEGRPIYSLSVGNPKRRAFFADAGIHPYEWAPCFGLAIYAARLADEYEAGLPWARALLKNLRFKCVPVFAPDGWAGNARSVRGVNLNRNFPLYWDDYKGDDKGKSALSEPEAQTIARILESERPVAAVSWHETSANTNWVGMPGFEGRYESFALSIPHVFRQFIDLDHFYWQASQWTQVTDPRNFHYHRTDSYPYLRDYGVSHEPYEIHYSNSLGIASFLVEQYGNSEMYYSATPQRTDMTCRILEMLFGLQIGLVARNHSCGAVEASVPLVTGGASAEAVVYAADGGETDRRPLRSEDGCAVAEGSIPPGGCLVVELDPPPWESASNGV